MMAAISSKLHNKDLEVILVDRNNELGKKLKLTGGGRCNVTVKQTNEEIIRATPKNGKFLYSSLTNFNPDNIISFFEELNCSLKIEDHDRVFPKSNNSLDIINALKRKINELNIKTLYNTLITNINIKKKLLITNNKENLKYDFLIIATGGVTYPHTGSDGTGYTLAKALGHTVTKLLPAEVPLVSNDLVIQNKTLQGLSFKDVNLRIYKSNKIYKQLKHDLIITHFGLSGPLALRASFYIQELLESNDTVNIQIDFLPTYSKDDLLNSGKLDEFFREASLPARLITYIKETSKNKVDIITQLKEFPLEIYTTRGFKSAFVTNGGISLKEIDPKTMKSKLNNSVSFCGEILDLNSFTGGYNITSAFATGFTAGRYLTIK